MAALSTYCYEGLDAIIATATAPPEQPSAFTDDRGELLHHVLGLDYAHSIEAMRGRPPTSITDAIHAARSSLVDG